MKKILCLIIILIVLLFSVSAFAETEQEGEFTIRNGIRFGMSFDDVVATEKSNGNDTEYRFTNYDAEYAATLPFEEIYYYGVNLAGIDESELTYRFSKNDNALWDVEYELDSSYPQRMSASNIYAEIKDAMIEKYGEPVSDGGFFLSPYIASYGLESAYRYSQDRTRVYPYYVDAVCQWMLEYEDYCVMIDLYIAGDSSMRTCRVGYRKFATDEIATILEQVANAEEELETKMNSDL